MIELTLVVPLFNRPRSLARILEALRRQTLPPGRFEATFVDDSGPESYARQKAVLDASPPRCAWTYLTTGLPRRVNGVSVARNLAIRAARGRIIVFMDDDVAPHPSFLETHAAAHRENAHLMAVGNRLDDESLLASLPPLPVTRDKCRREMERSRRGRPAAGSWITSNASARKAHLEEAGLFDESFAREGEYGYEDTDMARRLLELGLDFRFLRDAAVVQLPSECDPWEGKRDEAKAAARARHSAKHGSVRRMVEAVKARVRRAAGKARG